MVHVLIGAAVAAAWALSLLLHPFGRCPLCAGRGNLVRWRRAPVCPLCHGTGRRQRTGSRTVHRIRRQVIDGWRDRR
jgi:RecJ-like exonuclease